MRTLDDCSVDAVVTDPPYELGFMGKKWDASGIAYDLDVWRECLRVMKPGGHLIAFGGTRTSHRMVCAIEDAGFEVRDSVIWMYGSGFPKSLNVSKAIDAALGAELAESKQWDGWGTALKPAHEPACLARKPLCGTVAANVLEWGTGGINVGACRVENDGAIGPLKWTTPRGMGFSGGTDSDCTEYEISDAGRWPANLIHDNSPAIHSVMPNGNARYFYTAKASRDDRDDGLHAFEVADPHIRSGRKEGAAGALNPRSMATGKARNIHPTVKPTDLMAYLCRLVTPPGGTILDPFCGSGSTGRGAMLGGFKFIGIELDAVHCDIARARIQGVLDRGVQGELAV